ncbi:MAG: nitroreductase [Desulfobacterota bacterium]|nr:nitroreductase [Thermodesulfobacteriota bacterium]
MLIADVFTTIRSRSSIRSFEQRPVDRPTLLAILEDAHWAPSASNQQPWHFIVVTGKPLLSLCDALQQARIQKQHAYDPSRGNTIPPVFVERTKKLFRELRPFLSTISDGQRSFIESGSFRFYGAPVVIFIALHRALPSSKLLDIGMAAQNIMLSAHARGIGTCAIALTLLYKDVIHAHLELPSELDVVLSLALGYPDTTNPINTFRSSREDITTMITWCGFDSADL